MEEKVKEIVEIKQRSLAEENQKTLEVLKERYNFLLLHGMLDMPIKEITNNSFLLIQGAVVAGSIATSSGKCFQYAKVT